MNIRNIGKGWIYPTCLSLMSNIGLSSYLVVQNMRNLGKGTLQARSISSYEYVAEQEMRNKTLRAGSLSMSLPPTWLKKTWGTKRKGCMVPYPRVLPFTWLNKKWGTNERKGWLLIYGSFLLHSTYESYETKLKFCFLPWVSPSIWSNKGWGTG